MISARLALSLALLLVLAAPGSALSRSDIAGPVGLVPTVDETTATTAAPVAQQAASGGKASGHVDLSNVMAGPREQYSFTAVAIEPSPSAKGRIVVHVKSPGSDLVATGSVVCMTIVGNQARVAALWETQRVGNVDVPPPPGQNLFWTVEDNGEGAGDPPDRASEVFQTPTAGGQFHCATGFALPLRPNERGNIQVRPA